MYPFIKDGILTLDFELAKEGTEVLTYKEVGHKILGQLYMHRIASLYMYGETPAKRLRVTVEEI